MGTRRSRRRDAELRVLEAAHKLCTIWGPGAPLGDRARELFDSVEALTHLPLEEPDATRTGHDNPNLTSSKAGEWMKRYAKTFAFQVLDEIYKAWDHSEIGLTTEQVGDRVNGSHQSVSPRVTDLRDRGYIVDSGQRRLTRSGNEAVVWSPSSAAILARRGHAEAG